MRTSPTILARLLLAYVVPALVLFSLFAFFAYDLLRRDLDAELGRSLEAIAAAATTHVRAQYLLDSDPPSESAVAITRHELDLIQQSTGVARIMVFTPAHASLCDTRPGVTVGQVYHELDLDRHELEQVLAGQPASSVSFIGSDGVTYKAGYAPLYRSADDHTVVAGLRVEAPAAYFEALHALYRRLLSYGALLALAVVLASFVMAALITRPLRKLAAAARRIGEGDLEAPVALPARGRDEMALLGRTLDEMREALRARDERLRMMLAGIAHEVRNPLGGIELYAGILREELAGDAEKTGHVARIERELKHLSTVVADFLEYARRPRPDLHETDLAGLCRELAELAAGDARAASVTIAVDVGAGAPRALADAGQLRRALLNLLRNAIQATAPGGEVRLSTRTTGGDAEIVVADTGKGVAPDDLAKIWNPFYTTKEKGTGLGLAFVKEIVADHGGQIAVASEVGAGTTFTITLPRA